MQVDTTLHRSSRFILNPFEEYNEEEFYRRYRLNKSTVRWLSDEIFDFDDRVTATSRRIPDHVQLLLALRYYACGSFQSVVGDTMGFSQATIWRAITKVSTLLSNRIDDFIVFPTESSVLNDMKTNFYNISEFPNCVGCVDCTHIRITAPCDFEYQYVNRKGYHSLNVQGMCDYKRKFTNLVVKWPGSNHDSWILKQSNIWNEFENGHKNGIILGDSAYPCRNWLMTPIISPRNHAEERYWHFLNPFLKKYDIALIRLSPHYNYFKT